MQVHVPTAAQIASMQSHRISEIGASSPRFITTRRMPAPPGPLGLSPPSTLASAGLQTSSPATSPRFTYPGHSMLLESAPPAFSLHPHEARTSSLADANSNTLADTALAVADSGVPGTHWMLVADNEDGIADAAGVPDPAPTPSAMSFDSLRVQVPTMTPPRALAAQYTSYKPERRRKPMSQPKLAPLLVTTQHHAFAPIASSTADASAPGSFSASGSGLSARVLNAKKKEDASTARAGALRVYY